MARIHLPFRLRDIMPHGLYPRSVLIVVLPVILLLGAVTYVFYDSHWRQTSRKMSQGVASSIAYVLEDLEADPSRLPLIQKRARDTLRMDVDFVPAAPQTTPPTTPKATTEALTPPSYPYTSLDDILARELSVRIDAPYSFDLYASNKVEILIQTSGGILRVRADRDRTFSTTGHIFIVWVILSTLVLVLLALGFLRSQVRSILKLTDMAKAFGRGQEVGDIRPSGATEIRDAAKAVLEMRRRLTAFAEQRTAMLAGVSHDLRTPLTRLKLQLAMMEATEDNTAARRDLSEMEAMLDEYLAFARQEETEGAETLSLDGLLRDAASHHHGAVRLHPPDPVRIEARPVALKRAVSNLLTNAVQYGDAVEVSLSTGAKFAEIIVDDDGPGLDPDQYEDAFRPFSRIDPARNQNIAGSGLGLALARDTARAHGGDVRLDRSPLGGLRATLRLPL
ncbi:MAG: ATP-binding protein [Pseudomonadota bacterium]